MHRKNQRPQSFRELEYYKSNNSLYSQYNPEYWAGIDCMRFVIRAINAAKNSLTDSGLKLGEFCQTATCAQRVPLDDESNALDSLSSGMFNDVNNQYGIKNNVYYAISGGAKTKIHQADFGTFATHVYTILSDRWGQSNHRFDGWSSNYDVIHAFGFDCKGVNASLRDDCRDEGWWFRKVGITSHHRRGLREYPDGFGRLILWE